jgi:ribosomal protein S18 acetylase RimI-like enzyme
MMDHFLKNLKDRGSKGLHLGLGKKNQRAYNFYKKYGLTELKRNSDTIFMGISFE